MPAFQDFLGCTCGSVLNRLITHQGRRAKNAAVRRFRTLSIPRLRRRPICAMALSRFVRFVKLTTRRISGRNPTSRSQSGATSGYRRRSVSNGLGTARTEYRHGSPGRGQLRGSFQADRAGALLECRPTDLDREPGGYLMVYPGLRITSKAIPVFRVDTPDAVRQCFSRTLAALPPGIFKIHRSRALWDGG